MMGEAAALGEARRTPRPGWRGSRLFLYGGVFLGALLARLHGIGLKPFWMDEVTTIERSSKPFLAMIVDALTHHHLPTYFILSSWVLHFGSSETVLRLPSAIFGALSCGVLASIGRRSGGWRVGLLAGLLMAFSPIQVQYAQEARPYALMMLGIVIALKGLVELALDPAAAGAPIGAPATRRAWGLYLIGTLTAINVLSAALPWLIVGAVAAAALALQPGMDRRQFLRNWVIVHVIIGVLSIPLFIAMSTLGLGGIDGGLDWVPPLTAGHIWSATASVFLFRVSSLISFHLYPEAIPGFAVMILGLAVLGVLFLRTRPPLFVVIAAACTVLPLLLLAISLRHPVWMPRYVLWSAPAFFLLVAFGLRFLPAPLRSPALALLILLAGINLLPYYRDETKPRWDLAASALKEDIRPGDLVLVRDSWRREMMELYLARTGAPPAIDWTTDVAAAMAALRAGRRVWAIDGRVGQTDHRDITVFLDRIAALGQPDLRQTEGRDIQLMRFDPTPEILCANEGTSPSCSHS